ncbi:hypothetical protein RHGRI_027114 [Rhododendron griersonianum]|uniref:Ribosomal protein L20 n=1 Tax=Rhododendron griersonianum TaxID=479676 RepID=A0AAV6IXK9_9ERIC|nr:hypothetical protein RHGRI_027114 [Rhododendron griersonianum]
MRYCEGTLFAGALLHGRMKRNGSCCIQKSIKKSILKLSLAATVYGIWCERNMRIFQHKLMEAKVLGSKICNNIRDAMMAWHNIKSM